MKVSLEVSQGVALITISNPAARNALTGDGAEQLISCLGAAGARDDVAAVVLRGDSGTFCSGADRALLAAARDRPTDRDVVGALTRIYDSFVTLGTMSVPTIAAVRGAAVGAGLNLALAADVRIVADDARFISGFLRIGLHPGGGHFTLLDRVAGPQTTVAMTILGEEASGSRLVELGLAWESVLDGQVEDRALELAARARDAELVREATSTFRAQAQSRQLPWRSALRAEQASQLWSLTRTPPQPP